MRGLIVFLTATFVMSGCATAYVPAPLPSHHPANPAAPEAPPPPLSRAFSEESVLPTPAAQMPTQRPQTGHGEMQDMQNMHGGH